MDTIDLSNLNRQFLFQKQHIKKSKAHVSVCQKKHTFIARPQTNISIVWQVAKESALRFNPSVNIVSHHANIKDKEFSIEWFKAFDLVLNALDNLGKYGAGGMTMPSSIVLTICRLQMPEDMSI